MSATRPDPDLAARLRGAVWGHLVGDAVGVPYEFGPPRPAETVVFGATGMHQQPPGTWSDDGALMLALLDSLLTVGFDTSDQGTRALAWFRDGAFTPDHDGRFDWGNATSAAMDRIAAGVAAEDAGGTDERSNGNGSLMRILPLALVQRDVDDATLIDHAHRASRVTHGTPEAQATCALYSLVVRRLLADGEPTAALEDARSTLRSRYVDTDAAGHLAALDRIEGHATRGGRGSAWDAFWSAWDAFAGADDHRTTVQRAVAFGEDTDTTAAIAGGLAGVRWGIDGIPPDWLGAMRGTGIVEPLLYRLVATTNPIRVDWVDLGSVPGLRDAPGRLGMTFLPGKRDESSYHPHRRDLAADVRRLREVEGTDTFVLLVEDDELAMLQVPDIADVMRAIGIDLVRYPIKDVETPTDASTFGALLDDIDRRLRAGQRVVVACRGGLGRTGTVVGCVLAQNGLDGDAAIALTRASRHGTIETPGQKRYVREWRPAPAPG